MRNILIQTETDRGTKQRISTHQNKLALEVFFKGENDEVMKEFIILRRTEGGSLRVENENGLLLQTTGGPGEKLPYAK